MMFGADKQKYFLLLFWGAALIFVVMAVALNIARGHFIVGSDSAQYIIIAESLAHGQGLKMLNYPGEPVSNLAPLLSVIMAPVIFFFGRLLEGMYTIVAVSAAFSLAAVYKLFRLESDRASALWVVVLLATSSLFLSCSISILTDIVFFPLVVFALYFLKLYIGDSGKTATRNGIACAVFLVLSFLCRYIGVTAFLTAIVTIFFCCRDRNAAVKKALFLSAFFLPVLLSVIFLSGPGAGHFSVSFSEQILSRDGYGFHSGLVLAHPEFFLVRCWDNIVFYLAAGAKLCFSPFAAQSNVMFIGYFFMIIVLYVIGYGLRRDLAAKNIAAPVFFCAYIFFLIIWPFHEEGRYLLPLAGYLLFYFVSFLRERKIFYAGLLLTIIAACNMLFIALNYLAPVQTDKVAENFISVNERLRTLAPDDGIVMSRKPAMTFFYSGHKSVPFPFFGWPGEAWRMVRQNGVKYIVFDQGSNMVRYAALIDAYRDDLKYLYGTDATAVFKVDAVYNKPMDITGR